MRTEPLERLTKFGTNIKRDTRLITTKPRAIPIIIAEKDLAMSLFPLDDRFEKFNFFIVFH
jgi:hypothetical protein